MFSVKRVALLAVLMLVVATGASASSGRTLRGEGLALSLPRGWHGLVGPGAVQAADFPLGPRVRDSEGLARVRRGHVHLMLSNGGPWVPYLPAYRPAQLPLTLAHRNVIRGGLEGFSGNDAFARREVLVHGEMVEILADLGPRPLASSALRKANSVLGTLRVPPPRVLHPNSGRLAADGVSVRLLAGWAGHIEIPGDRYGARIALRATRGDVHIALLELTGTPVGEHLDLPVVLARRNVLQGSSPPLARRVFSTSGRSFDLSVTIPSSGDLREANRLLRTLTVAPRRWTFHSCTLSLRLPGTWRVAVRPRSGCYPVLTLHGPGAIVVLTELRPGEHATGRILRRNGRRFHVEVTPASARARADAVLATLRAERRS